MTNEEFANLWTGSALAAVHPPAQRNEEFDKRITQARNRLLMPCGLLHSGLFVMVTNCMEAIRAAITLNNLDHAADAYVLLDQLRSSIWPTVGEISTVQIQTSK